MNAEILYYSNEIATSDRIPLWTEVVWNSYVPLAIKVSEKANFVGNVSRSYLGSVRIVTSGSRAQQILRTPRLIAQDADEYLMLGLQLQGTSIIEQHEKQAFLHQGDFVFWDTRRPYKINFPNDWEMAVFQFPRNAFGFDDRSVEAITASALSGKVGMSHIAAALLMSIAQEVRTSSFEHKSSLLDHTLGLLSLSIDNQLGNHRVPITYDQLLYRRIESYILKNLQNPQLRVADIAQENGLTVFQIYRLFQQRNITVVEYIRRKRLQNIKEELASPRGRNRTISAIARKWGFIDIPHFNRVFKSYYKTTPTQFRASRG